MTIKQISEWINNHMNMQQKREYKGYGRIDETIVHFENGDIFHQITDVISIWKEHTIMYINGKEVYSKDLVYEGFGWKELED